jgi:UDP:flavonoid glycosyltransferase YjiC (YdhE family)
MGEAIVKRGHNFTLVVSSVGVLVDESKSKSESVGQDSFGHGMLTLTYPSIYNRSECLGFAQKMATVSPISAAAIYVDVGVKSCDALLTHEPLWDTMRDLVRNSGSNTVFLGEWSWPCSSLVADILDRDQLQLQQQQQQQHKLIRLLYQGNAVLDPFCEYSGVPSPANEAPGMGLAVWMLSREPASFPKRLVNLLFREVSRQILTHIMARPYNELRRKSKVDIVNTLEAMQNTAAMVLIPIVWGVEPPRSLPPSWKAIPPVLPSPAQPLAADLQGWIHEQCSSRNNVGLVILSFGTQATLTDAQVTKLFDATRSLRDEFCFIWQLPAHSHKPHGLSDHGHILPLAWIPQNDLMGHAKTVAFVSHVGYGSLYEAAYHGIPIVCLPLFGDQDDNCARTLYGGWGIRLNKDSFTAEEMAAGIRRAGTVGSVLQVQAAAISRLVRSESGPEEVVKWMEYAASYGVDHLVPFRSAKASYVAYYNIDAGLFAAFLLILATLAITHAISRCIPSCTRRRRNVSSADSKKRKSE